MPHDLKPYLVRCGYRADLLVEDYEYLKTDGESASIPLLAFSDQPTDARSACIAVLAGNGSNESAVRYTASTGAPYALVATPDEVQWWLNRRDEPKLNERVPIQHVDQFFDANKASFDPDRVFRAKTLGSLDRQQQLTFVDVGLMQMVEGEIGKQLSDLIGRVVKGMLTTLGKNQPTPQLAAKIFRVAFWLLAGKMLRDKRVPSFKTLDVTSIDDVFDRVGRHYGVPESPPSGATWTRAAQRAASEIASFATLANVSTESLGYLYESTMVPPHVRKALGIHSTPAYLIDYMVWQMADWLAELPEENRHVFEPACGHGGFLVASVRLLRELLGDVDAKHRTKYLRSHIHGLEIDAFAIEIARLSLTLADIPNPNGWQLHEADAFESPRLEIEARRAGLLLANPPFENFSAPERNRYRELDKPTTVRNKAGELLLRTLPQMRPGAAFGVVIPQGLLHSNDGLPLRKQLLDGFELREICLFPDKVFSFGDSESAILLGRRKGSLQARRDVVAVNRVREGGMPAFRDRYQPSSTQLIPQLHFEKNPLLSLRVPELLNLWSYMEAFGQLDDLCTLGQGLAYRNQNELDRPSTSTRRAQGFVSGLLTTDRDWLIHSLPPKTWMSVDDDLILHRRAGKPCNQTQVVMNYAPVSRGSWRIKAAIDSVGVAVSSRFIAIRPRSASIPAEYIWALMNSPIANAYAYSHLQKRDILVGTMRRMPVPAASRSEMAGVAQLVKRYMELANSATLMQQASSDSEMLRSLLAVDASVLRLYDLPPRLERHLLELFEGQQRAGVPFRFKSYYPTGLKANIPLHRLISDELGNSTAGHLRRRHHTLQSSTIQSALDVAASSFEEG